MESENLQQGSNQAQKILSPKRPAIKKKPVFKQKYIFSRKKRSKNNTGRALRNYISQHRFHKENNGILKTEYRIGTLLIRWQIQNFRNQFTLSKKRKFYSDTFTISSNSQSKFAVFFEPNMLDLEWKENFYGIDLKELSDEQSFKFDIEVWLENGNGEKIARNMQHNCDFNTVDEGWQFKMVSLVDHNRSEMLLNKIWTDNSDLFICCKLSESDDHSQNDLLPTSSTEDFSQNNSFPASSPASNPNVSSNNNLLDTNNLSTIPNVSPTVQPTIDLSETETTISTVNQFVGSNEKFRQEIWKIFEDGEHDATIVVGEKKFKVMKIFFTCHSIVLKRMFENKNVIHLNGINEETVMSLIKWSYTGEIEDIKWIYHLYIVADKCKIEALKDACIQRMPNGLDKQNSLYALLTGFHLNNEELKAKALECIGKIPLKEYTKIKSNPDWMLFENNQPIMAKQVYDAIDQYLS